MTSPKQDFNKRLKDNSGLKEKLQQIFDALPAQLVETQRKTPEKDILLTLVPLELPQGSLEAVREMYDTFFTFKKKLAAVMPDVDMRFDALDGVHGTFAIVSFYSGVKNSVTLLEESGIDRGRDFETHLRNFHDNLQPEFIKRFREERDVGSIGYSYILAFGKGMHPTTLPPVKMEYANGKEIPGFDDLQRRVLFWDVDTAWKRPEVSKKPPLPPSLNK